MIRIDIPGYKELRLEHLVLDYNGTLAVDGELLPGVMEALERLSGQLRIHVVTADTFGKVGARLSEAPCTLSILPPESQDRSKQEYIRRLGADSVACIGNGRNDRLMLEEAGLSIAVIQEEGAAAGTLMVADTICRDIGSALQLLLNPLRLTATLRS